MKSLGSRFITRILRVPVFCLNFIMFVTFPATIRGQKAMVDRDLAELYGVELNKMNQAAKRNIERFPADFMFQLTRDEWDNLRSQFATANRNISKIRYMPFVFTEHGVLMLSNVLNSSFTSASVFSARHRAVINHPALPALTISVLCQHKDEHPAGSDTNHPIYQD